MFLNRDTDESKDGVEAEFPRCSLPELYALVENFDKETKKSNRLKTHSISPSEAQKILSQNLKATPFTSGADLKDPQPVSTCKVVRKDEERPASMTDLLHRTLLTSSLSPAERFSKSHERIARYGIRPPSYTFPYEILIDSSSPFAIAQKVPHFRTLSKLGISHAKPEKLMVEDRISERSLVEPGNPNK